MSLTNMPVEVLAYVGEMNGRNDRFCMAATCRAFRAALPGPYLTNRLASVQHFRLASPAVFSSPKALGRCGRMDVALYAWETRPDLHTLEHQRALAEGAIEHDELHLFRWVCAQSPDVFCYELGYHAIDCGARSIVLYYCFNPRYRNDIMKPKYVHEMLRCGLDSECPKARRLACEVACRFHRHYLFTCIRYAMIRDLVDETRVLLDFAHDHELHLTVEPMCIGHMRALVFDSEPLAALLESYLA